MDRMSLLREFIALFVGLFPGVVGLGDYKSLFVHLKTKWTLTEASLARRFVGIEQPSSSGVLDSVYGLLGQGDPADKLIEVASDMTPMLRLFQSGSFDQCDV